MSRGARTASRAAREEDRAGLGHEHFSMDKGKYDYPKYSGANGTLAVQLGVQGKYPPSVDKAPQAGFASSTSARSSTRWPTAPAAAPSTPP